MKNPHLRKSLLVMAAFVFMLSIGSSWSCNTKFNLPLFYGNDRVRDVISEGSNKILTTLPEIARLGDKVSFPPDAPLRKALSVVFKFLKDPKTAKSLIDAKIEPKLAEDTIQQLNAHMLKVEKSVSSILSSKVSFGVKQGDWVTAVDNCEKVFSLFTESKAVFNEAKLATAPHYVAFATVYLTVAQLAKAFNGQYTPTLKKDLQSLLDDLAEFEFEVKPQRKFMLQKRCKSKSWIHDCRNILKDTMTGQEFNDADCHSEWRQELTNRTKKFFSPVKERIASFLGVPVPVKYQYYTTRGGECFYSCGYHGGKSFSWCWTLSAGLGNDWETCSMEKDLTIKGVKCTDGCLLRGLTSHWCNTASAWDYCSPVTIQ